MENIMKTSITLNTQRLIEVGQQIYNEYLRKRLIPEDRCADVYEHFINQFIN